jgi:hypothetical protein
LNRCLQAWFVTHVMASERRRQEERNKAVLDLARGFNKEPQAA